ncbi:MAG: hypothetical protein GY851_23795, partial [bacterium]|nr:hypothetical protein [bacterium]
MTVNRASSIIAASLALCGIWASVTFAGVNIVRNAGFELDARFNGGPVRVGFEQRMLIHAGST